MTGRAAVILVFLCRYLVIEKQSVPASSPAHINNQPYGELLMAFASAALLEAITAMSSFQDFTNDFAPSS